MTMGCTCEGKGTCDYCKTLALAQSEECQHDNIEHDYGMIPGLSRCVACGLYDPKSHPSLPAVETKEFARLVKLLQDQPAKAAQLILELREEIKNAYMFIAAIVESQPTKELRVSDVALRFIDRSDVLIKRRDERDIVTIVTVKKR